MGTAVPTLSLPCGERIMCHFTPQLYPWCVYFGSIPWRGMCATQGGGWGRLGGGAGLLEWVRFPLDRMQCKGFAQPVAKGFCASLLSERLPSGIRRHLC